MFPVVLGSYLLISHRPEMMEKYVTDSDSCVPVLTHWSWRIIRWRRKEGSPSPLQCLDNRMTLIWLLRPPTLHTPINHKVSFIIMIIIHSQIYWLSSYCLCLWSGHTWVLALNSSSLHFSLRMSSSPPVCCDPGHDLIFDWAQFWHQPGSLFSHQKPVKFIDESLHPICKMQNRQLNRCVQAGINQPDAQRKLFIQWWENLQNW